VAAETRATLAVPLVVLVAALPAFLPPVDLRGIHVDRAVQMAASAALGLWIARGRPWAGLAVLAGMTACLWAIALPRGPQWPSYSYADAALVLAVAVALYQLQGAQRRPVLAGCVALALALWLIDGLIMAPWCGVLIGWQFTAPTACGSAWGDPVASIPALLTLAAWLAWARQRPRGT
jgi:hypothetical protein